MDRRTLLQRAGGLLALSGLAGCLERSPAATDGSAGDQPTGTGSSTPTPQPLTTAPPDETSPTPRDTAGGPTSTPTLQPTAAPRPTPTELSRAAEFEVLDRGGATPAHDATAGVDGDSVVVEGTIPGANGCYTAELASATVDDGTLSVYVRSFEKQPETTPRACTQALVAIDYRARLGFEDGLPDRVRVVHDAMGDRTTVADVSLTGTATPTETATATGTATPTG